MHNACKCPCHDNMKTVASLDLSRSVAKVCDTNARDETIVVSHANDGCHRVCRRCSFAASSPSQVPSIDQPTPRPKTPQPMLPVSATQPFQSIIKPTEGVIRMKEEKNLLSVDFPSPDSLSRFLTGREPTLYLGAGGAGGSSSIMQAFSSRLVHFPLVPAWLCFRCWRK